ncbi:MAG: dihydroorotate dehydrogenase, partial [Gemmatimonadota bacterium]|nr:dihydroorotate dehydrogenase [Gemmatimonadota bacterium]
VRSAVPVPILGVGGVSSGEDALQYLMAGASLVGIGTAALANPSVPERVVQELAGWCRRNGVRSLDEVIGAVRLPS